MLISHVRVATQFTQASHRAARWALNEASGGGQNQVYMRCYHSFQLWQPCTGPLPWFMYASLSITPFGKCSGLPLPYAWPVGGDSLPGFLLLTSVSSYHAGR